VLFKPKHTPAVPASQSETARPLGLTFDLIGSGCYKIHPSGGAVAQLEARLDGIEEVEGSNPFGSTKFLRKFFA
jgi:hypothetical protein